MEARPTAARRHRPVRAGPGERRRRAESTPAPRPSCLRRGGDGDDGVLGRIEAGDGRPGVTYRRDGNDNVLVEYGAMMLDLGLRMRVHALQERLAEHAPAGILDVTPGIRSLQVHTDAGVLGASRRRALLRELEDDDPADARAGRAVPDGATAAVLGRSGDPAGDRAVHGRRPGRRAVDAVEHRVHPADQRSGSVEDVQRIVFDASYLVLGLGDVYLGAPVATPLDPRHRLVTTKYNPARTWTAENSVGIGGAYMCIYGMEGPGGYQFVGRTVQVWNRFRRGGLFDEHPWALRFFDRIQWYPVSAEELLELRAETDAGRGDFETVEGEFSIADYERFLTANADSIAEFRARQPAAFEEEKERWRASGEFDRQDDRAGGGAIGSRACRTARPPCPRRSRDGLAGVVEPGDRGRRGEGAVRWRR